MLRELETLQPPLNEEDISAQKLEYNETVQIYQMQILHFVS